MGGGGGITYRVMARLSRRWPFPEQLQLMSGLNGPLFVNSFSFGLTLLGPLLCANPRESVLRFLII